MHRAGEPLPRFLAPHASGMRRLRLCLGFLAVTGLLQPAWPEPGHVFAALDEPDSVAILAACPARHSAAPVSPRNVLIFYRTEGYVHDSIALANYALTQVGARTGAYGLN